MSIPEVFRNVLIVRTDRIGDVILTLPVATVLKRKFPSARVTMLVRDYAKPLVVRHPDVDETISIGDRRAVLGAIDAIKERRFTCAVCASPSFGVARALRRAGIPVRIGTAYRWYAPLFFNRRVRDHRKFAEYHEVECNVRMIDPAYPCAPASLPLRLPLDEESTIAVQAWLGEKGIAEPFAVVHPGSGGSARELPPEHFARLALRLRRDLGYRVILTGTRAELPLLRAVETMAGGVWTFAVDLPLNELAALIARAECVLANSTGVLHIAAAVGTYAVGFYPPIRACSPRRWGPWTDRAAVFTPDVRDACNGCATAACALYDCMRLIPLESVMEALRVRTPQNCAAGGA